ncbi:MAG: extensin family protein [Sphingorhabdus sp.]
MKRSASILVLALLAATLSACGGRQQQVVHRSNDSFKSADSRICLSNLKSAAVRFSALPNQNFSGGCHIIDTIKLLDFGTSATNLGAMTCPLAANFAAWAKHAVRPAARQFLGSEVIRIETFGTYSCRNVNGGRSGKLSQHSFGNAVDVSAFILKDGRRVSVLDGWRGTQSEQAFLRRLHQSACKRFGTVLGPNYNTAHANHFHFDMAQSMKDGSAYCR